MVILLAAIAYIISRTIKFELSSSLVVFIGTLIVLCDETRFLALLFVIVIIIQSILDWEKYAV